MYIACMKGHLSVCEWLFEVGAAADITKVNPNGTTPIFMAGVRGVVPVCKFLILNGAVEKVTRDDDVEDEDEDEDEDELYQSKVSHLTYKPLRRTLLAWVQEVVATHHIFFHVVLRASVILPNSHQQASPEERCHLPRLPRVVLERLGDILGVEMVGRRVRNAREFAEALEAIITNEKEKDEDEADDY